MEAREFIEVGATVRVENGPAGASAARGKPLDWYGPWVWYVSELRGERWEPAGEEQTKEAALEAAGRLAQGG